MSLNNFKCEKCGRNMGDIDQPICHQCEVAEQDACKSEMCAKGAHLLCPDVAANCCDCNCHL